MDYSTDNIRDNRTLYKARRDYLKAQDNEERVMSALYSYFYARGFSALTIGFEKIDPDEAFADNRIHRTPDYYFWYNNKKTTLEIKVSTTSNFHNDQVYVKPGPIFEMKNEPTIYPNGHLLVATNRAFAVMKVSEVMKYPCEEAEEWSTSDIKKKAFKIPVDDLQWHDWLTPLELA